MIDPAAWDADTHRIGFASASGAGPVLTFGDGGAVDVLDYSLAIDGITVYSAASTGAPAASLAALAAAINDDEGTTGVRAFIDAGVLYLERTSPPAGPIVVTESMSGGSDGDTDTVVGYFGAALSGASASTISRSIDGVDRFLARNGSGVIVAGGDFRSAVSISFGGVSTSVTGSPAPGDEFTLSPSVQQDMFTTLDSLVSALASAVAGSTASTVRANAINRALSDIDQAMERLLEVRAGIGARLGVVELVQQTGEDNRLLLQTSLSELRDVDFAEAISRLASQQAALEAAQQSFVRLQSLSLFNFL